MIGVLCERVDHSVNDWMTPKDAPPLPRAIALNAWKNLSVAVALRGGSNSKEVLTTYFYSLILPLFNDPYPRVRYAACQCV